MLFVNMDMGEVADLLGLQKDLTDVIDSAARDLAAMTHAKIVELANEKLHSRRQMFVDALHMKEEGEDGVYIVSLDAKVRWIDDGQPAHNMLDQLLASPKAKTAKDGSKYLIVPFNHGPGQGPTKTTQPQQDLIGVIKSEMKQRGIPFGKIEKDATGSPKIGKLHSFTIDNAPAKTKNGPGMGHGALGDVRQGPTGTPFLENVTVYQGKTAAGKTKRSIMTFRVASSKHDSQARWDHPGNAPMNLMEDATVWAVETFDKEIAPALLTKILAEI